MEIPAHWKWKAEPLTPGAAAIFDLDGVLADALGRQHFLDRRIRDWDGFFEAAGTDTLLHDSAHLLRILGQSHQLVVLTARPLYIRPTTLDWLEKHDLPWDLLVMRPDRDRSPSRQYKQDAIHHLRSVGFDPKISFEDDIRNVEMLRAENIPCVYIHSGYYD